MRKHLFTLTAVAMALVAVQASAKTQDTATNAVSPTLVVKVSVDKAVSLTLAAGTQCAINPGGGGDYNVDFGTVDALAITAPTCGSSFAPTTPGTTNAVYYTDYKVTPIFTSQAVSTNTITAYVSTNFLKGNLSIVQSNALPGAIGALTAMSLSALPVASQTNVATDALSGTAYTRYVGVSVAPTNGAALTGADSATITYTLTVQ